MDSHLPATDNSGSNQTPWRRFLIKFAKLALIVIVLYFAGRQVVRHWDEVVNYPWTVNVWLLILSFVLHLVTLLAFSRVWCFIIAAFGYRVRVDHAFKISYLASLGRYIPGKIWQLFGMTFMARQIGIKEEAAMASWVISMIFTLPPAFLVGFFALGLHPELVSGQLSGLMGPGLYTLAGATLIISLLLIIIPNRMLRLFNPLLRMFRRPPITFRMEKSLAVKIYAGYFVCWVMFGTAFWLFLSSITVDSNISLAAAMGAYVLAYQIGFVALFAPGGLGVRELALTAMMAPYFGPIAPGVAIAARLWNLLAEILAALAALPIKLKKMP